MNQKITHFADPEAQYDDQIHDPEHKISIANNLLLKGWSVALSLLLFQCRAESSPLYPAFFVFGDSLVDVGNNNYLRFALARADSSPNGIDFPTHNATGRFCNGKMALDFLAEDIGLEYPPPYLAPTTNGKNILQGVNYASGGGGILDESGAMFLQRLSFNTQLDYFRSTVTALGALLGATMSTALVQNALYVIEHGTNDYLYTYLTSNSSAQATNTTAQFHALVISKYISQLTTLYTLGARKIVVISVGPLGCIPYRLEMVPAAPSNSTCIAFDNEVVSGFNSALQKMLPELTNTLEGAMFVYADIFSPLIDLIRNPTPQGFKVNNRACCEGGIYKGQLPCNSYIGNLCRNRTDYIFWDRYHPTEAVHQIFAAKMFSGSTPDIIPMNIYELSQWSAPSSSYRYNIMNDSMLIEGQNY